MVKIMKKFKLPVALSLILVLFAFIAACSASPSMEEQPADGGYAAETTIYNGSNGGTDKSLTGTENAGVKDSAGQEQKVVTTGQISMETLGFEKTVSDLVSLVSEFKGYYQYSSESGFTQTKEGYSIRPRTGNYVIRIPSKDFLAFSDRLSDIGNITYKALGKEDITLQYTDTVSRLNSLKLQEQRIIAILAKATVLTDVLELENKLSQLRYEIENLTSSKMVMDSRVSLSTLTIDVKEVSSLSETIGLPKTLGEKIAARFTSSIEWLRKLGESFLIFIIGDFIQIVIFVLVVIAVIFWFRHIYKKRKEATSTPVEKDKP